LLAGLEIDVGRLSQFSISCHAVYLRREAALLLPSDPASSCSSMAAPRHDSDNPHPTTPVHGSPPRTLTVASRNHLRKFIGHVLDEETDFRDADRDAWVSGIEGTLNDLAREVNAGAWLSGIRRARALGQKRREQAAAEARKREQERIAKEKETEARNKAKTRAHVPADMARSSTLAKETDSTVAEAKSEIQHSRKPPPEDANRNLRALQQLRNLAKRSRASSSDDHKHAHHLLLTVVLPDASSPPPHPSSAAAGNAPSPRCTFTPCVYSLPAPDLFGEDPDDNCEVVVKSTLYGFREWDGALRLHSTVSSADSTK
jgi:1-phosphatidylinositol-3-phosphate 5-kinase